MSIDRDKCTVSTRKGNHFRHCFMTGEYCSKQRNISLKRKKTNDNGDISINAFVIMDYSDTSRIIYEWRIKPLVELLKKYLYYDTNSEEIICTKDGKYPATNNSQENIESNNENAKNEDTIEKVKEINLIRADDDISSNFVICNRICQQLQIADLVIVDLSVRNVNVFYELGMAIAMDKLILPICYHDSFFAPAENDKILLLENAGEGDGKLKNHLGYFPWRKELYESFGMIYRDKGKSEKHYISWENIEEYGKKCHMNDIKYSKFPYNANINGDKKTIGKIIYERLDSGYIKKHSKHGIAESDKTESDKAESNNSYNNNTVIIYDLNHIENEDEIGSCIVNFYNMITKKMHQSNQCFAGNRVGILAQDNRLFEKDKDAENEAYQGYGIGDMIMLGMNEATFSAYEKEISAPRTSVAKDLFQDKVDRKKDIKAFLGNRSLIMYPEDPVYVDRLKTFQKDLYDNLKNDDNDDSIFCFYHVMLDNLKYVNEVVVDITDNSIQNIFWLGVAHGLNIKAITVRYNREKEVNVPPEKRNRKVYRNIFDVAGLWMAEFSQNHTTEFYDQLHKVQHNMEQQDKLIVEQDDLSQEIYQKVTEIDYTLNDTDSITKILEKRQKKEKELFESYYRRCLWNHLIRYNELSILMKEHHDEKEMRDGTAKEPSRRVGYWDVKASALLSNYLSKRTAIGEYTIDAISPENEDSLDGKNVIYIGAEVKRNNKDLAEEIFENNKSTDIKDVLYHKSSEDNQNSNGGNSISEDNQNPNGENPTDSDTTATGNNTAGSTHGGSPEAAQYRKIIYTAVYKPDSSSNSSTAESTMKDFSFDIPTSKTVGNVISSQYGQLLLWKEKRNEGDSEEMMQYFVSLNGCSGPSTYGLASLLTDEEQKESIYGKSEDGYFFLYDLQQNIREDLMEEFKKKIYPKNDSKNDGDIVHSAIFYTDCMLDKIFFPFHTKQDINTICNSLKLYLYHYASNENYEKIDEIAEKLESLLDSLRGVQVFYDVRVRISNDQDQSKDIRELHNIYMVDDKYIENQDKLNQETSNQETSNYDKKVYENYKNTFLTDIKNLKLKCLYV